MIHSNVTAWHFAPVAKPLSSFQLEAACSVLRFGFVSVAYNVVLGTATTATPQAIVHRVRPSVESDEYLKRGAFGEYLAEKGVESATLEVEPGDFYIFNAVRRQRFRHLDTIIHLRYISCFIACSHHIISYWHYKQPAIVVYLSIALSSYRICSLSEHYEAVS